MAAIKRPTAIKGLVFKATEKDCDEKLFAFLYNKDASFESARLALLDFAAAVEKDDPGIFCSDEPEYSECCKPFIRKRKKFCAECGLCVEGFVLKDEKAETSKEVDEWELESWVADFFDGGCSYDKWESDFQLRCLTEPSDTVVVFNMEEVLKILLEGKPREMDKLFADKNSRVVDPSFEMGEDDEEDSDEDGE
jgi:hypothetical protein